MASTLIFNLLITLFALLFLCNTNSCLASSRLLLLEDEPKPSLDKATFPAPDFTPENPSFSSMLPPFPPSLTSPPLPPAATDPSSTTAPSLWAANPNFPSGKPFLPNFTPFPFPFPRLLPLPRFPPFPFIPTMPSVPTLPAVPSLPTGPSGFVSSPSEGETNP